jgi:predicted O-methyltransferase YrrM
MSVISILIGKNDFRNSRLRDEEGNMMPLSELNNLPKNAYYWTRRKLLGKYSVLPWWPFNVIDTISNLIKPDWKVVEFGSGMSTIWLSQKVQAVVSIEDNNHWHAAISEEIARRGIMNVDYRKKSLHNYHDLSEFPDNYFDFAIIDGAVRWKCAQSSLSKVKDGGIIYLDNSDADKDLEYYSDPAIRKLAQGILQDHAERSGGRITRITGMTVGLMSCHQGMLLELRK